MCHSKLPTESTRLTLWLLILLMTCWVIRHGQSNAQLKLTSLRFLFPSPFFHSHYWWYFTKVADYPKMMTWLLGQSESEDVEVWGVNKVAYIIDEK